MKVISADFITSAALRQAQGKPGQAQGRPHGGEIDGIPRDGIAQIALAGRSNVGKSTLLNALVRRKVARTSAAPGKTRLVNVFRVVVDGGPGGPGRWSLYLVDLPGFGYARGGEESAKELAAVAEAYFAARGSGIGVRGSQERASHPVPGPEPRAANPGGVLLLVDARHPGLEADRQAHQWLASAGAVPHVVATKIDKLSRTERVRNLRELERLFGNPALPVSAVGGEGMDELWRLIAKLARGRT